MYNLPQDTKGKVYITKAGYVIPFLDNRKGDPEYCPFTNDDGQTASDFGGWKWQSDGSIFLGDKTDALEIVGEYNYRLQLPSGYKWKGGFPKLEEVRIGDFFLADTGNNLKCRKPLDRRHGIGNKRIILEPAEQPTVPKKLEVGKVYLTKGGWLVRVNSIISLTASTDKHRVFLDVRTSPGNYDGFTAKDLNREDGCGRKANDGWLIESLTGFAPAGVSCIDSLEIVSEYTKKLNPEFPDPPKGYKWKHDFPKITSLANGEHWLCLDPVEPSNTDGGTMDIVWRTEKNIEKFITPTLIGGELYTHDSSNVFSLNKKEEIMKKETAIAVSKSVGSFAWKTVNYLFLETATEIGKRIGRSVRYAVFFGSVATAAGLYFAPDATKGFIKSCLPKVSISIDAPDIVK